MNKIREEKSWYCRMKIVSGILTVMLVFAGLAVLLPLSSDEVVGYNMPSGVSWDMDDLVANSTGAVTMGLTGEYFVHEDIEISSNSSLTIYPGEMVYFDLDTGFTVYGHLTAEGDNVSMVTFTSNESSPSYGDWDGISFYSGTGNLDFVSISYAENGIMVMESYLSIPNSEFTYNVWGVHIMSGSAEIYNCNFTSNGILPHPDPFYSVGGGVYTKNNSQGMISSNDFISNIGGVRVGGSWYLHINSNFFYDNSVYGIYIEGGDNWTYRYVNIVDNVIMLNENYGIFATLGFESYIGNNNITNNRVGIYIAGEGDQGTPGGGGGIYNNYIAHNWENGIECYGGVDPPSYGTSISGNDIISNGIAGIYVESASPSIDTNYFIDNYFGVYTYDSNFDILTNYFESNDYAVWANLSDVLIKNCEILSSVRQDFYLENDAYITSLNTTFDDFAVHFADDLSILEVQWYLHILVINSSGPVPSADVTVSDNENGTWSQNYVTDAFGRVNWIITTEYIRDSNTWIYYTPHNITAIKDSELGYAEPFMDISKLVVVDISPGAPPPIPPLPPEDLGIILLGGDLELTWGASPDDGAGANDVTSYEIYRADSINGPYINIDSVLANDSYTYSWFDSGKGDGEWNNYFYIVRAKDEDGLEDDNENKVGKFVSALAEGWNLISVPLVQSDTTREVVLQTVDGNYASVYGYHAGKSRPWLHWHRDKPNKFNDVIEINHMEGYYIDMIIPDSLVTVGRVPSQTDINLKSGWNLVGYPCLTEQLRDDALSSITGKYNIVERYDTTKDKEVRLGPNDYMMPGDGHWIHCTENCVWTITN